MPVRIHPAFKILLICLSIGLAFGTYLYFSYDPRPERIAISVFSTGCIGSLTMLVISYRTFLTICTTSPTGKMIIIIGLLILAALLGSEITFFVQSAVWDRGQFQFFKGGNIYALNILIVLVTGIPSYVSEEYKSLLNSQILSQQYKVMALEQQKTAFELELLRAKVNPHFLYNVHNTIAGLISKDPAKAEELVLLLSRFFRFTLNKDSTTFHSVQDEIDIIKTYLDMQQIRFESRMRYSIDVDPLALYLEMPSFILQPLVENAVKHGIETRAETGFIDVKIEVEESEIVIKIFDSGPGFLEEPGTGMGLQMVKSKLELLYPGHFKFELNNIPEKYVRITIPKRN